MHQEGVTKFYSLRTLSFTSSDKFSNVHTTADLINDMGDEEAASCTDLVHKMGSLATAIHSTKVGSWNPQPSQSFAQIAQLVDTSTAGAQLAGSSSVQIVAEPPKLDSIPVAARKQFEEAILTASKQAKVGLTRLIELKKVDAQRAAELKELLAQLTTMKNSVQHVLDFSEDVDGTVITEDKLSHFMKEFAQILTKVSLALTNAQNVIKVYSQLQP